MPTLKRLSIYLAVIILAIYLFMWGVVHFVTPYQYIVERDVKLTIQRNLVREN